MLAPWGVSARIFPPQRGHLSSLYHSVETLMHQALVKGGNSNEPFVRVGLSALFVRKKRQSVTNGLSAIHTDLRNAA
jgi:hypothetical protein